MPKKIDDRVKERCVRQVLDHLKGYPSLTAAAAAVAPREGVGKESGRRWVIQAQIDAGQREGPTTEELAEIRELKSPRRDPQPRAATRMRAAENLGRFTMVTCVVEVGPRANSSG